MHRKTHCMHLIMAVIITFTLPALAGMENDNYYIPTSVISGGGGTMDSDTYQTETTLGQPLTLVTQGSENYALYAGFWQVVEVEPVLDYDNDGILNDEDNCPNHPNGSTLGTCVTSSSGLIVGVGATLRSCTSDGDCGVMNQLCQLSQGNCNSNGIGDACECYSDCDCDNKVNLDDLIIMKIEYFRNDCAVTPCQADCTEDGNVNLDDLIIMKYQYFRNDCPSCP